MEPRLIIVSDPSTDCQAIKEARYMNIPVIALANADSPLSGVDVAIPCNNRGKKSIALVFWLLAKEVLQLRGQQDRNDDWNIMVDLFMHREILEDKKKDDNEAEAEDEAEHQGVDNILAKADANEEAEGEDAEDDAWEQKDTTAAYQS